MFFLPTPLFASSSGTPITCMWMHLLVFYISPKLCKFFFNIFPPLCSSDYVVSTDLSSGFLILYFTSSNLQLKPFSEFFILVVVIFTLTISTWFYFIISIFYSCSLFGGHYFFTCSSGSLGMAPFSSFNIFIIVTLEFLSALSIIWACSKVISICSCFLPYV